MSAKLTSSDLSQMAETVNAVADLLANEGSMLVRGEFATGSDIRFVVESDNNADFHATVTE